jgi:hypothetical protein
MCVRNISSALQSLQHLWDTPLFPLQQPSVLLLKPVNCTYKNMGATRCRTSVSKTSILACVIIFIVVLAVITEAHPLKGARHKRRRHGSSGNRRSVAAQRTMMAPRRRHNRNDRAVYLSDAVNMTLCAYSVHDDVMEGRVPKIIRQVRCMENGCRCRVVNSTGTYACTQLVTNMIVTVNSEQLELQSVPYACVCASRSGVEVHEESHNGVHK